MEALRFPYKFNDEDLRKQAWEKFKEDKLNFETFEEYFKNVVESDEKYSNTLINHDSFLDKIEYEWINLKSDEHENPLFNQMKENVMSHFFSSDDYQIYSNINSRFSKGISGRVDNLFQYLQKIYQKDWLEKEKKNREEVNLSDINVELPDLSEESNEEESSESSKHATEKKQLLPLPHLKARPSSNFDYLKRPLPSIPIKLPKLRQNPLPLPPISRGSKYTEGGKTTRRKRQAHITRRKHKTHRRRTPRHHKRKARRTRKY
jgi:hypothetical protein